MTRTHAAGWTIARAAVQGLLLAGVLAVGDIRAAPATSVRAEHAWIRVLPADLPAGGYVTLTNGGDRAVELTGAESGTYESVMLHESSTTGGTSRMTMVHALTIPAHGTVTLAPAGYHLMLMHARAPVQAGERVPVTLTFADGSTLAVEFLARPANALDDGTR